MSTTVTTKIMEMVLESKLETPMARAEVVSRPRLLEMLDGDTGQLAVVSAPAGSGKSTLLAQWARTGGAQPVGWLSVDTADNDPTRFCVHMVAALRRLSPRVGERALLALGAPGAKLFDVVLPLIVDDLREESVAGNLILDDYHVITNPEIHRAMKFFLDHRPSSVRMIISSRDEPPLQLAARRVRGQLREVTGADLRFTTEEVEQFLNRSMGLDLTAEDVGRLADYTEGWTAGVYLAALSLQGNDSPVVLIDEFERGHRHVTDFLVSEVMSRLSDDVQTLMVRTSILERFNADLANAVADRSDAAQRLEEIERSNLFLIPLDTRREWFRYHHLFAELLRRELVATAPASIPGLHKTAAQWYMDHGHTVEAVQHAISAEDTELVSDLVAQHWISFEMSGQVHTVLTWFDELGDDVLRGDARLAMAMGMTMTHLGRLDDAEAWIAAAESIPDPPRPADGIASIESGAAIARALRHHLQGDFSSGLKHAETAVRLEPFTSPWRSIASLALGGNRYWLGDRAGARSALDEAVSVGTERNMHLAVIMAKGYQSSAAFDEGRLAEAEQTARGALDLAEHHGATEYTEPLMAHVVLAKLFERDGDYAAAATHADRALMLGRRTRWPIQLALALMTKGSMELRRGDRTGAARWVSEAQQLLSSAADLGILGHLLTTIQQRAGVAKITRHDDGMFTEALTDREFAVLTLLPTQLAVREIADELFVSPNTVKTHTRAIYRKLGVSDRGSAVERARTVGIL